MRETLRHREAFEYYYSLGEKRSYPQVASKFAVSVTSVKKWAKAFNWQERVEQRDIENARKLEKKTNEAVVETKANYRKIVKAAIARWVENFRERSIEPGSVQDLERLIKLDLLLMGEDPETKKAEALQTWVDMLMEELNLDDRDEGSEEAVVGKSPK